MSRARVFYCLLFAIMCVAISGCLTPIRFWMPHGPVGASGRGADGKLHSVTNTWHCYPTVWMRVKVTEAQFDENNTKRHWANWIPITVIWLTVPLDAAIDTILLPYDVFGGTEDGR